MKATNIYESNEHNFYIFVNGMAKKVVFVVKQYGVRRAKKKAVRRFKI